MGHVQHLARAVEADALNPVARYRQQDAPGAAAELEHGSADLVRELAVEARVARGFTRNGVARVADTTRRCGARQIRSGRPWFRCSSSILPSLAVSWVRGAVDGCQLPGFSPTEPETAGARAGPRHPSSVSADQPHQRAEHVVEASLAAHHRAPADSRAPRHLEARQRFPQRSERRVIARDPIPPAAVRLPRPRSTAHCSTPFDTASQDPHPAAPTPSPTASTPASTPAARSRSSASQLLLAPRTTLGARPHRRRAQEPSRLARKARNRAQPRAAAHRPVLGPSTASMASTARPGRLRARRCTLTNPSDPPPPAPTRRAPALAHARSARVRVRLPVRVRLRVRLRVPYAFAFAPCSPPP